MTRWLSLVLFLLILSACEGRDRDTPEASSAPSAARPAERGIDLPTFPEGFRGLSWGTELSGIHGLEPAGEAIAAREETAFFTRGQEPLELDGFSLTRVLYGFRDGRLEEVLVVLDRPAEAGLELKEALFRSYGPVGPFISSSSPLAVADAAAPEHYREYRWTLPEGEIGLLVGERNGEPAAFLALSQGRPPTP